MFNFILAGIILLVIAFIQALTGAIAGAKAKKVNDCATIFVAFIIIFAYAIINIGAYVGLMYIAALAISKVLTIQMACVFIACKLFLDIKRKIGGKGEE